MALAGFEDVDDEEVDTKGDDELLKISSSSPKTLAAGLG